MNDAKRPGGDRMDWVDPERKRPLNAFDKDDQWFGQAYSQEREERSGARMPSGDVAGHQGVPAGSEEAGEDSFDDGDGGRE